MVNFEAFHVRVLGDSLHLVVRRSDRLTVESFRLRDNVHTSSFVLSSGFRLILTLKRTKVESSEDFSLNEKSTE